MHDKFILVDKVAVEESDLMKWGKWMEKKNARRVASTKLDDGTHISTVFLGLNHNFDDEGPPLLFETMVFLKDGKGGEDYMERYTTYKEAESGHKKAVAKYTLHIVKTGLMRTNNG